jgi:hypothetical protein
MQGQTSIKRYFCSPSFSCVGLDRFERKSVSTLSILCLRVRVKLLEVIYLSAGRFSYNSYISQKSKYHDLPEDVVRDLFLKEISEEYLEMLNLMASSDISHKPFAEICEMCKNYSRSRAKIGKNVWDPYNRSLKPVSSAGITREEIGNLLEKFKTEILSTIGS